MTLSELSKEYSCVNLPLPVPTCFHGQDYQKDLSSSQPEGMAQGYRPESLPLPSHIFLEEKEAEVMFILVEKTKTKQTYSLESLTLSERQIEDFKGKITHSRDQNAKAVSDQYMYTNTKFNI